jgi:hypothetical protein
MSGRLPSYEVVASRVQGRHIYFNCPFCWSKYNQNGQPSARAKPAEHEHGIDAGDVRIGFNMHRIAHCSGRFPSDKYNGFLIQITSDTVIR